MGRGKKFFIISIGVLLTLCFIYRLEFYKSIPSGQIMWNVQDPEQDEQSIFPIADVDPIRKTLYIAMDNNTIKALNVSGKEKWNIQLNEQCFIKNIKVCPDGNVLIISDNKPFLTKINPDGQILYQSSTESNINGISASDTLGGPAAAGTLAGIQTIAEIIILESIPTVYYRKYVYYKYIIGTDPPLPRAEKCYTYFYRDSERTDLIGSTVDEYYVPGRS